ncbi:MULTISPECIES: hypothetical protein [unclassified Caballeronia]|uniref:hypothetical protein n=1 Tax=unclassified Caballeronia TaxID=2646786 RepID=UPI0028630E93|nr:MULTISPECIES: hypothetical protein [unclassified Caballeronia]MDR5763177.1 hypothetical protein [Caballeronia sp. LZ035]MDR5883954.1 hypothetical protein [Caballeronia sp. LZ032]
MQQHHDRTVTLVEVMEPHTFGFDELAERRTVALRTSRAHGGPRRNPDRCDGRAGNQHTAREQ